MGGKAYASTPIEDMGYGAFASMAEPSYNSRPDTSYFDSSNYYKPKSGSNTPKKKGSSNSKKKGTSTPKKGSGKKSSKY
jgi:hypothetical protein